MVNRRARDDVDSRTSRITIIVDLPRDQEIDEDVTMLASMMRRNQAAVWDSPPWALWLDGTLQDGDDLDSLIRSSDEGPSPKIPGSHGRRQQPQFPLHRELMSALVAERKRKGITLQQVATAMEIDRSTVGQLEKGVDALLSTLIRYATAIGAELHFTLLSSS